MSASERLRVERRVEAANKLSARLTAAISRRTSLTSSGLLVLGLSVLCWVVAYVAGGRPLFLLSYACLVTLGLAVALTSRPMDLHGSRDAIRPRVREGEQIEAEIRLSGSKRFSTFVLEEEVPTLLDENPRIAISAFEPGDEVSHTYTLTLWRRGAYQLGPLTVRWGDPFGLTQRRKVLAPPFEVLVHPNVTFVQDRPLTRMWEDPPVRPPVSKPWPTGLEFYGMREYVRGDDPRRIVWRAYARTATLLVRESEQGVTDKLVILVDTDRRTHSKGPVSASFEAGVSVAASVAHRHIDHGYNVTVESNSRKLVGPVRGPAANLPVLDALARLDRDRSTLAAGLGRLAFDGPRDSQVVVVTPLLDVAVAGRLSLLVNRGSSVMIVALLWNEDAVDTLASAAAIGAQVVKIGPKTNVTRAFAKEIVGSGT